MQSDADTHMNGHGVTPAAAAPGPPAPGQPSPAAAEAKAAPPISSLLLPAFASSQVTVKQEQADEDGASPPPKAEAKAERALSACEYADRMAQSLARMLRHTCNQQWRQQCFVSLGVSSAGEAQTAIRELLEETLQLHARGGGGSGAGATSSGSTLPASSAAVAKFDESLFKQDMKVEAAWWSSASSIPSSEASSLSLCLSLGSASSLPATPPSLLPLEEEMNMKDSAAESDDTGDHAQRAGLTTSDALGWAQQQPPASASAAASTSVTTPRVLPKARLSEQLPHFTARK